MVFHWSLSDSKPPQVSRILLGILADLNNVIVGMASTRPLISSFSSLFNTPSITVPKVAITIGINVTFMIHCFFFNSLARSRYLSFFSFSFNFTLWSAGTAKPTTLQVLFLLFTLLQFFTSALADGLSLEFHRQQVSSSVQELLSILAILNNDVVCMVSTSPRWRQDPGFFKPVEFFIYL